MATQYEIDQWFKAIGTAGNYRTMHYFDGDGNINRLFEINFEGGYINRADVKAFMTENNTRETQVLSPIFQGPNSIRFAVAVPTGWTVLIYRDTPKAQPLSQFVDGAIINANNLDRNAKQAVFAVSEMVDRFDSTVEQVNTALEQVYQANLKADDAVQTANAADAKAELAINTANAADGKADLAIQTANSATQTANSAVQTANGAVQTANEAKQTADGINAQVVQANQTADEAKGIAQGIDGKATQAINTANAANGKADQAIQTANGVDAKATKAMQDSEEALDKANQAIIAGGIGAELVSRVKELPPGTDTVIWKGNHTFQSNTQRASVWTPESTGAGQQRIHYEASAWTQPNVGVDHVTRYEEVARGPNGKSKVMKTVCMADPSKWPAGVSTNNASQVWEDNHVATNFHQSVRAKELVNVEKKLTAEGPAQFLGNAAFDNTVNLNKIVYLSNPYEALTLAGKSTEGQYVAAFRDGVAAWYLGRPNAGVNSVWNNYLTNCNITLAEEGVISNKTIRSDSGYTIKGYIGVYHKVLQGGAWEEWERSFQPALQADINADGNAYTVWRSTAQGVAHVASTQVLSNAGTHLFRLNAGQCSYTYSNTGGITAYRAGVANWSIAANGNIKGDAFSGLWATEWVNNRLADYTYSKQQSQDTFVNFHKAAGEIGTLAFLRCDRDGANYPGKQVWGNPEWGLWWTDHNNSQQGLVASGLWRCLGGGGATLWIRVQ